VSLSDEGYRYLIAKNADNEGFFLIWDGSSRVSSVSGRPSGVV